MNSSVYSRVNYAVCAPQVLDAAKNDGRVKGLMAVLGGRENFQGMAQIQAMRNAVTDFKVRQFSCKHCQKHDFWLALKTINVEFRAA